MGLDMFVIDKEGSEEMYWRKANQIHSYFVKELQDGIDDCGSYLIKKEVLEDLKNKIELIQKDKSLAKDLLPTQSGFFFGGTDYDDYYFFQLENTLEWVNKTLENWCEKDEIFYATSW